MKKLVQKLFRKSQRGNESQVDFDHVFYSKRYPDLVNLKGYKNLLRHFVVHGRNEGRSPTLKNALETLESFGKNIPHDFEVSVYRLLNPDLWRLYSDDWQYKLHFLESGAEEGRPYKLHANAPEDRWQAIFNLYDFSVYSSAWRPKGPLTVADAITLFTKEGINRLVPVAQTWRFDPVFYRDYYNILEIDPVNLYKQWLFCDLVDGFAPNESQATFAYLEGDDYPTCFDWRSYLGLNADALPTVKCRINALKLLFEQPLSKRTDRCISGKGAAQLYATIGGFHLLRGENDMALLAFNRSIEIGGTSKNYMRRGDTFKNLGLNEKALSDYKKATSFPNYSIWSLINAAILTLEAGDYKRSFGFLAAARERWRGHPEFRNAVDQCLEIRFQQICNDLKNLVKRGEIKSANDDADTFLGELTQYILDLKLREVPSLPIKRNKAIIVACMDLQQCKHYRVDPKIEQLSAAGFDTLVFDQVCTKEYMNAMPGASVVIFYRVASSPAITEAILYARQLSIITVYEIDDLIFSTEFPDNFESYGSMITSDEFVALQCSVPLYRHAISLCDYGIASTGPLAEHLKRVVKGKQAFVVENGIGVASQSAIMLGAKPKNNAHAISIFYGSGTKAHNEDFNSIIGRSLVDIMLLYPQVRLTIVGYLKLDQIFEGILERIDRYHFIESTDSYWSILRSCDINISVLSRGAVSDCKSEIKWLEAALLQIPSVLSPTATYVQTLINGEDCLMAETSDEWFDALKLLIERPARRLAIAASARIKALSKYSLERTSIRLKDALSGALYQVPPVPYIQADLAPLKQRRVRLLICNVFFSPQSYGGATRVVEDNVDYIIRKHAREFDISIMATDDRMPSGQFRVDSYKGCKVFRLGTPIELNMDWRPFNPYHEEAAVRVMQLFQPDIIHFHCIQRLTASIVKVAIMQKIPFVVTAHDAWWISDHQFLVDQDNTLVDLGVAQSQQTLPAGISRLESIERFQRLTATLREARIVFAVSSSFADIYQSCGIDNVEILANGISDLPPKVKRKSEDRLILAHIGGRSVHKGSSLIEMVLRDGTFARIKLIMVDGSLEFGEEKQTIWGKTEVCLVGPYPQKLINKLFALFDVLLAPSIWPESHGLVSREAAFYGKWVVASDRGAIGDDVSEGIDGNVIDVSDAHDLTRVLTSMNNSPEAYKNMRRSDVPLRTAAEQAEDLIQAYRNLLRDPC